MVDVWMLSRLSFLYMNVQTKKVGAESEQGQNKLAKA